MKYTHCVLIGRFEPFHNEHLKLLKHSLKIAELVIIVLGSNRCAPNFRNPWSVNEREEMIYAVTPDTDKDRIRFVHARDHTYNDGQWLTEVQQKVNQVTTHDFLRLSNKKPNERGHAPKICLNGNFKDDTSYYLNMFPQWDFIGNYGLKNDFGGATMIREGYFSNDPKNIEWMKHIPSTTMDFLEKFKKTDTFWDMHYEWQYLKDYRKSWENVPFPPIFVTTDAVVIKSGHVLIVKRGHNPGAGLLALPGGFLNTNERIEDCVLRELKEETKIMVPKLNLRNAIRESKVFDHPKRSLRGRTITHAFYIKLNDQGALPEVVGSDDAKEAFWLPINDVFLNENRFFEDHIHIINHFISRI
jgi:bifunctional NMN adenylyltransferase/nudix hydrolase